MPDPSRPPPSDAPSAFSRRDLVKGAGLAATATALLRPLSALADEADAEVRRQGPGAVALRLKVNGEARSVTAEPRATLLDVLRASPLDLTGAKPACDRGQCGACTVWLDGAPVLACSVLALEAEGREVTTVEGLGTPERPHPVQAAFVAEDAGQCGFCTPGMVMSAAWAVKTHGAGITADDVREACAGNLCRCGTYPHVVTATLRAAEAQGD